MTRTVELRTEYWKSRRPFRISRIEWNGTDLLVCEVRENGLVGRAEAAGVYYMDESLESMRAQIDPVLKQIEAGVDREQLQALLPPGGARNLLDCALWDLEAQRRKTSAWELAGVNAAPVVTVFTIGLEDTPEAMAEKAASAADRPLLKIKLNADRPVERVAAIRKARPDARMIADCNGGWTFAQLKQWAPEMAKLGLQLLEQPLPRGGDAELEGYSAPLPLFADESCLHLGELEGAARRYNGIVIKLDKTGGLTEALALARAAEAMGLRLMVGCMLATSMSMMPAHVVAQLCEFVDIDGPLLLESDREGGLRYEGAKVTVPANSLWGMAA